MPSGTFRKVYINAAFRSPIGKFGSALKSLTAADLAARVLKESLNKTKTYEQSSKPDFVIMGHARMAGAGPNTARQATIFAGLSESTPAWTVNQACASGMTAVANAVEKIQLGRAENIWAGGVESMSNTPFLLPTARWGARLGNAPLLDAMHQDGFFCPMAKMLMGETVENFIANPLNISRKEQDEWALRSHKRAALAWDQKYFADEIIALKAEGKFLGLDRDENIRAESTLEALSKLPTVFSLHAGNQEATLSAGNSSPLTDGAAWLWLSSAKTENTLAEVLDHECSALDPRKMGLGPVACTQTILKRNKVVMDQLEAIEINEAFAAQVIACQRELKIPEDKINQRGGAIAIGHPIGASGARILVTLAHQLKNKKGALGLASLCVSGGQGYSMLIRSL